VDRDKKESRALHHTMLIAEISADTIGTGAFMETPHIQGIDSLGEAAGEAVGECVAEAGGTILCAIGEFIGGILDGL